MGLRALPLSPSQNGLLPPTGTAQKYSQHSYRRNSKLVVTCAKKENGDEEPKKRKQSLFESVTEALDFSQVRSAKDAELLEEAREATRSGERMSREQEEDWGTYKDFFKSYWMGSMWKRDGWTRPAKCARKTPKESQGKLTSLGDMFMLLAWKNPVQGTSLQNFSSD
ncbi:hypothetical protein Pfo_015112, partial [Paulownia fortunei]